MLVKIYFITYQIISLFNKITKVTFSPGEGTETIALAQEDGTYKPYGHKWFSSATDAEMTLTLARICDSQGRTEDVSNFLINF